MSNKKHHHEVADHQYRDSFELLFNQIEDCLYIVDIKGGIIKANKAALEKLENTHEEIVGLNVNDVLVKTMTSDITESRKQEEAANTLKNTKLVLDGVPFLAWMKDREGKYIVVNHAFEEFYNIKNTDIMGKTDFDIFPYEIALQHKKSEEALITSKKKLMSPLHSDKVGGRWLESFVTLFFEDDGEVAGTLGVANNITVHKQLEIELNNQKRFLKTMLDTIPDFIFFKDLNSRFLGCNKAMSEKVLGLNTDEVKGKTDLDLIKDLELAEFYRRRDREVLLVRKTLKNEEKIFLTDGTVLETETVKTPFWDEQGNIAGLIGIARDITERKRLEKQLRKQAEYAEQLFRTVPSAVVSVDKDRRITRWNKIAEEISGYTAAEVLGKECSWVLHGVGIEGCEMCRKAYDSPLINQMSTMLTKDGQIRYVLKSIAVVKDEHGRVSEKVECFEDITSLIKMEAELRESKDTYAAIVNNAPQIVVIHRKGIIQFVNNAGNKVLGYKEEECIGHHMKDFMTESSLRKVDLALKNRAKGKDGLPYEIELIQKSGEICHVLLKGTDITFEGEQATLAVMMDITESKQLNAKLRASEEKFRQIAKTINEIFLISDREKIIYVSPAYERISGMSCQSLLDNQDSLVELIHPADRGRMKASIFHSFHNIFQATNEEFRIIRQDGEIRWLWLQSYPIRDGAIESTLKATSIVDITDRKIMEEQLRERERQTQMELLLAERVQRDSLPHPFVGAQVRVETIFEPYRTVSGDFFNYQWFEDNKKLCGYIMDVSGHGVATALQTATFKMMLDNVLLTGETVEEDTLRIINQRIIHYLYEDSFLALLYFEFDLQAGVLKLISAGITLFLAANTQECSLAPISGCYLGIIDDPEIETKLIPLRPGDIFCLMSDGASDLIELLGISKQDSFTEYKNWLEKLARYPERNDDFSVICIEILEENMNMKLFEIKNNQDLQGVQVKISEFLEQVAPSQATTLEVAINEALNNGLQAGGRVCVKLKRMGDRLIIRVKDDGPGFNTEVLKIQPDKGRIEEEFDELSEAEGGRGILLMRLFCDKVVYNAMGNEVLLMKKNVGNCVGV
ncbi:PAS domain S-box protein [Desulfosporosinus sp.]|uniref:PAS domain S-box protein n=1 Tax=Desulfosporosinus sp. TaxID=157907 RepID=UPI0025C58913|nr:PAS domain S-box protein [Desulfosporosinus sp.]MBC2727196.1 PAS domain S-box protein [Desulfosporosinus sp.]